MYTAVPPEEKPRHGALFPLLMGALGVVYGDIGTSPLYALKECFSGSHGVKPTPDNILGVLSLMFWSLTFVVTLKYLVFIMRADNKGEGGMFSLLALVPTNLSPANMKIRKGIVLLAIFGAALLYGDGVITPAISVLSAVEGLGVATHAFDEWVVPVTLMILLGLFLVQKKGTAAVGRVYGPVMAVWFSALALVGLFHVVKAPTVLRAVNPWYAVEFFINQRFHAFVVLGAVVLCITGAEALYADMGHFGKRAIRLGWMLVFPALLLNYLGQGAYLLTASGPVENPFYALVPPVLLYPMVALATVATVIASQAMISGAFSLTRQAVQLGYCPRVTIVHTSSEAEGQIYIPEVNQALMVACLSLVLAFRESSGLAAAYGIAVTGTFTVTSVVFYFMVTRHWKWSLYKALPLVSLFLFFDLAFLGANALKILDGGWIPLTMGLVLFVLMLTWRDGRTELSGRFGKNTIPLSDLMADLVQSMPHRVRGTAVFMSSSPFGTPPVMLHHLKHNQVLHQQVVVLSILSADEPLVPAKEQVQVEDLGHGFFRVAARYGFMQTPNVPAIMRMCRRHGLKVDNNTTSYYLGRETLLTHGPAKMMHWRKVLFAFIARNARSATSYFGIPPGRVVELGMQVDL